MLGQDRPEKTSAEYLIRSGKIPSSRQTSIHKTNDSVSWLLNEVRSLGASTHRLVSVHNTTGDTWRALARRLIQKYLFMGV